MANKYFVWKDPNCNGEDIEWIEMDNIQFSAFIVLPENKFRRFIRLGNQICHEADVIILEATESEYQRWSKERRRSRYLQDNGDSISFVSIDAPISTADELTLADVIPAEDNIEDTVFDHIMLNGLAVAISHLCDEDRVLLEKLYTEKISLRHLARQMGISHNTLDYRVKKIFEKMKKYFGQI